MFLAFRTILFVLLFLVVPFLLQYFLSTREAKWPGLILPALCLLLGLVYTLSATTVPAAVAAFLLGGGVPCLVTPTALIKKTKERCRETTRHRPLPHGTGQGAPALCLL